jgi:hypothetical protein
MNWLDRLCTRLARWYGPRLHQRVEARINCESQSPPCNVTMSSVSRMMREVQVEEHEATPPFRCRIASFEVRQRIASGESLVCIAHDLGVPDNRMFDAMREMRRPWDGR